MKILNNWKKFNEDTYVPDPKTSTSTYNKNITPPKATESEISDFWREIISSPEKVEKYIKEGGDPDFGNSFPIRLCVRGDFESKRNAGKGYFESFMVLMNNGAKIPHQYLKWAAEYARFDFMDYLIENGFGTKIEPAIEWLKHSNRITDEKKEEVYNYLKSKITDEEIPTKKAGYNVTDKVLTRRTTNYNTNY